MAYMTDKQDQDQPFTLVSAAQLIGGTTRVGSILAPLWGVGRTKLTGLIDEGSRRSLAAHAPQPGSERSRVCRPIPYAC